MSYWLRLYTDVLNDAKLQALLPEQFKGWINLLCLAKESDGVLPAIEDIAYRLHITGSEAGDLITALRNAGFIDQDGDHLTPHNWAERQYSDVSVSTERVKRFREKRRNAAKRSETNAETLKRFSVSGETSETQQSRAEQRREEQIREEAAAEQSRAEADVALPAAAAATSFNESHSSAFAFPTVEDFVRATKPHIKNPGGLARKLWRSGEEDSGIGQWLIEKEERRVLKERLRESAAEEEAFSMDEWVSSLIDWKDDAHLEQERDSINQRGGPKLEWEHRVIAYFNNHAARAGRVTQGET